MMWRDPEPLLSVGAIVDMRSPKRRYWWNSSPTCVLVSRPTGGCRDSACLSDKTRSMLTPSRPRWNSLSPLHARVNLERGRDCSRPTPNLAGREGRRLLGGRARARDVRSAWALVRDGGAVHASRLDGARHIGRDSVARWLVQPGGTSGPHSGQGARRGL